MVMLRLLRELAVTQQWRLVVAHINHQLRGRSSDADERFVVTHCQKLGLPCVVSRRDVKGLAKQQKVSIEMAARDARHQFLAQTARRRKCRMIVLAHHADDQAELVLLRLIRGSGSEGLGGMSVRSPSPTDPNVMLLRPLLEVRREQILAFAKEYRVQFREDRSNASRLHMRNRVRHELLPLLRMNYQPAIATVLCRAASILSAEADFMKDAARQWLTNGHGSFAGLPLALQRRVLQLQVIDLGVAIDFETVEQLLVAPECKVNAPEGHHLVRRLDGRVEIVNDLQLSHSNDALLVLLLNGFGEVAFAGRAITWHVDSVGEGTFGSKVPNQEWFDAERVGQRIVLRHWQPGDRFQPIGMNRSVKLQDLFTNLKVARAERIQRVVAESASGEIFWVEGLRIGERFKLLPDTRKQLVWRWNCC
jgi:tRNA(Ile)-lysidine synthase